MPLVKPLSNIKDKETQELVTFFNETLGFCPNSVLTMQKKPNLAQAFVNLNKAVMDNAGSISSEFKRIIAYISSNTAGCRYCQAHTIRAAERYGEEKERLEQAWDFENSSLFTEAEKVALRFTIAASSVPVSTSQELEELLQHHWNETDILEIMSVIALFGYLNRWNDVMGTSLEQDAKDSAEGLLQNQWDIGKHAT
ncbi:MAG: carboxymuconolactone decarboxylase family protein [Flavobacteriia bacterium]|nr:carboxymuconolactone decarboxylase family protein [Flavobacteriia bacterium]